MQVPDADKPEWLTKLDIKEMKIDWNVMAQKESSGSATGPRTLREKAGIDCPHTGEVDQGIPAEPERVVDSIDLPNSERRVFHAAGSRQVAENPQSFAWWRASNNPRVDASLFDNRDVTTEPANRRGIGFVFQNYALFPHLSVAENVGFGLRVRKVTGEEANKRVAEALNDVQLTGLGAERVDRLSGGTAATCRAGARPGDPSQSSPAG
jgi:energy-coupling factor transporter ATP-binding protein EcfA2